MFYRFNTNKILSRVNNAPLSLGGSFWALEGDICYYYNALCCLVNNALRGRGKIYRNYHYVHHCLGYNAPVGGRVPTMFRNTYKVFYIMGSDGLSLSRGRGGRERKREDDSLIHFLPIITHHNASFPNDSLKPCKRVYCVYNKTRLNCS